MKAGPVIKLDKKIKQRQEKIHDDVMLKKCDVLFILPNGNQFGVIQKPDSSRILCKTYIFIKSNLLSYKN